MIFRLCEIRIINKRKKNEIDSLIENESKKKKKNDEQVRLSFFLLLEKLSLTFEWDKIYEKMWKKKVYQ